MWTTERLYIIPVLSPTELRSHIQQYMLDHLPQATGQRPELDQYAHLLREYPGRGGKMLRGMLLCYSGMAHGAELEQALPLAAALELFQNWALVHDDIEDGSDERRGKPALHKMYGMPLALNAGDALHARMWDILIEARTSWEILKEFSRMVEATAVGQHFEINWVESGHFDLREEDYLYMVSQKAAYYTAVAPLKLGALCANAQPATVFDSAGLNLGIGFQIVDDVLNLVGDAGKYGKEIAGDLWEGKRTLILLHYLSQTNPANRNRAEALLKSPREHKSAQEVNWLHRQLVDTGAVAYAQAKAEALLHGGLATIRPVFKQLPNPPASQAMLKVLESLIKREA
jgi:geranylgeranyl diphosphate synthase type II